MENSLDWFKIIMMLISGISCGCSAWAVVVASRAAESASRSADAAVGTLNHVIDRDTVKVTVTRCDDSVHAVVCNTGHVPFTVLSAGPSVRRFPCSAFVPVCVNPGDRAIIPIDGDGVFSVRLANGTVVSEE